jgi:hypothetical protein
MEAMPQTWNDDRMDELSRHMDAGFAQVRVDMGSMREEIKAQGRELNAKIERQGEGIDTRLDALNTVLVESQRTMIQLCGGLCFALIAAVATLVSVVL